MTAPNLFLVGAPKCGTTTLYENLRRHPEIFFPDVKEPNVFADDLVIRTHPELDSPEAYLRLYEGAGGSPVRGDASQFHLYSRTAARRLHERFPEAKILVALREPVSLVRSLHAQYLSTADEDVADLGAALGREGDRRLGRAVPPGSLFPRCMAYLDVASLADQVERYLDAFRREAVHVILLDDLRADAGDVLAGVLRFLGVAADAVGPATVHNVSGPLPPLASALEAQLRALLAPDVERLAGLIGRDLSSWLEPTSSAGAAASPLPFDRLDDLPRTGPGDPEERGAEREAIERERARVEGEARLGTPPHAIDTVNGTRLDADPGAPSVPAALFRAEGLAVTGWAVDPGEPGGAPRLPGAVWVEVGGVPHRATLGFPREDVAEHLGTRTVFKCGFVLKLPAAASPAPGPLTLRVVIVPREGQGVKAGGEVVVQLCG